MLGYSSRGFPPCQPPFKNMKHWCRFLWPRRQLLFNSICVESSQQTQVPKYAQTHGLPHTHSLFSPSHTRYAVIDKLCCILCSAADENENSCNCIRLTMQPLSHCRDPLPPAPLLLHLPFPCCCTFLAPKIKL